MQSEYCVQNSNFIRKRIVLVAIALIVISAIAFIIMPAISFAYQYEEFAKAMEDVFDPNMFGNYIQESANTMFGNYMDMSSEHGAAYQGLIVTTSLAASLFAIYLVITIIREALNGKANFDMFTKLFVKMLITFFILINLNPLTGAIHKVMSYFIKEMINALNAATAEQTMNILSANSSEVQNALNEGNSFNQFTVTFLAIAFARFLLGLPKFIVHVMILLDSYALVIELFLRKIFMPLATLSFLDDGTSRAGVRYIKRYAGVYMKMLIYIAGLVVAELIASAGMVNATLDLQGGAQVFDVIYVVGGYLLSYTALIFAAIIFARKSETLCDEVLGV